MTDALVILERLLGISLKTAKGEHLFHCPFCLHRKKKLSVNLGTKFGVWKCWVCHRAGRRLTSLLHAINAPINDIQKIREIDPEYRKYYKSEPDVPQVISLPTEYMPLWKPQQTYKYRHALSYLLSRGFNVNDILKHRIGYCESGPYADRLIIPSYDKTHQLNYFVSRSFYPDSSFKYKNPPISKNIIVFENMINWKLPIVLVEGVFDAITIRRNAIPLLGKFIGHTLLETLLVQRPPMIYVCLDKDAQEDAYDLCSMLRSYGLEVKNVAPSDKDANEMGFDKIWKQIVSAHEPSFKETILQKLYDS